MTNDLSRFGHIALIGRPNVGKSTLINQLVGRKIAAVVNKPQTTRYVTRGIVTHGPAQIVFFDTPGLHQHSNTLIHKSLNRAAESVFEEVDLIVMIVEACQWRDDDEHIMQRIKKHDVPCVLLANKVDTVGSKDKLLPWLTEVRNKYNFIDIVPVSARKRSDVDYLLSALSPFIPEGEHVFADDEITDRSLRFIVAEMVRETAMKLLRDELPHSVAVEIESYEHEDDLDRIHAVIWVSRAGHKGIVIGKQGGQLKAIGSQSRGIIERLVGRKVFLKLWVKVQEDWQNNERFIMKFGLDAKE